MFKVEELRSSRVRSLDDRARFKVQGEGEIRSLKGAARALARLSMNYPWLYYDFAMT